MAMGPINLFKLKHEYCKNKTTILKTPKIKIQIKNVNLDINFC